MPIVDTTVPMTPLLCTKTINALTVRYPSCRSETLTYSAFGRPVRTLVIGNGPRKVLYSAAHHANEWITTPVILKFVEDFAAAIESGGQIGGVDARSLQETTTIYTVPMVDPDGVALVTGEIAQGDPQYVQAQAISSEFPAIPFPNGWKANLLGVDLNLNYPAGWLQARENKFAQGFTRPAPRDFVGRAPLDQYETRALADYTQAVDPALVLAYHTQGKVIYWQFQDYDIPGARQLGERFAEISGYELAETPFLSAFAGYKDWFIKVFRRPGYTIEVGAGENPLPISQFDEIYRDNLGILVTAAMG
ncbi:MAG: gamma-D-glutamyl-meso-diaminopimelate peptidase [Ruminococcaceae bacterium]|nr:gamma-D-glutamyl-meso-diaminopimelate peptidase [Oscillospiraceae bacterium]